MANEISSCKKIVEMNTIFSIVNKPKSIFYINKNFQVIKKKEGAYSEEDPLITTDEAIKFVYERVQKIKSVEAIKTVKNEDWKALLSHIETYFSKEKDRKAYLQLTTLLNRKIDVPTSPQKELEYILSKDSNERTSLEWTFLQDAATLLAYEQELFELHFIDVNLELREKDFLEQLNKVLDNGKFSERWQEKGKVNLALSEKATLTSQLFAMRFNKALKDPAYALKKGELREILELCKSKDKGLKAIAQQYLLGWRYQKARTLYLEYFKTTTTPSFFTFAKVLFQQRERFAEITPDLFNLMTESMKPYFLSSQSKKEDKKKERALLEASTQIKQQLFKEYAKVFKEQKALYQKCYDAIKAKTPTRSTFDEIFKEEPLPPELPPLKDYKTATIELDIDQWEREIKAERPAERKKREEKKEEVKEGKASTPSLPPPPFIYNAWVEDWFKNPDKNLAHPKYHGKNLPQIKRVHIFTPLIDHFVKAIGIQGVYTNSSKTYESWTIGAEIEFQGKKRREHLTYGFDPESGILEHRSFTIADQESEIDEFLQESYDKFEWPELNTQANQAALRELGPRLCKKYMGSDKSRLASIEEYQLTFWDEGLKSWIRLMNPRGAKALQSL